MDPLSVDIRAVSPIDPAVQPLIHTHLDLMRASSPACSIHAMDTSVLAKVNAQFFAAFEIGKPVAIGGLKVLSPAHGELKSMHVRADCRRRGLADAMLDKLIMTAQELGIKRVSLETGSQDAFRPARAFYARRGFTECNPFEDYELDPNSIFLTCNL